MDSNLFKFLFFAIIVQCCHLADETENISNSSTPFLKDIMIEQKTESDLEKERQQSYRGKLTMMPKDSGTHSKMKPSEVAKNKATKLDINEATSAADEVRWQFNTLIRITMIINNLKESLIPISETNKSVSETPEYLYSTND